MVLFTGEVVGFFVLFVGAFLFVCLFVYNISCSPCWPQTLSVPKAGLEPLILLLSLPLNAGIIGIHPHTPSCQAFESLLFYYCFPHNIFAYFITSPLVYPQIPKFRGPQALGPVPTAVGVSIAIDKIFAAVLNMEDPVSLLLPSML